MLTKASLIKIAPLLLEIAKKSDVFWGQVFKRIFEPPKKFAPMEKFAPI
jgi:hypothetical protein